MQKISDFKIDQIPVWKIIFAATSYPDYEMDRVYIIEDYPQNGDYTVVTGDHCSCYDFDETEWEAITYSRDEIECLLKSWENTYFMSEQLIASMTLNYLK